MDGSGCCPDAVSSTARNTKNAASVGTSRCTRKWLANCETSDSKFASQLVAIPLDGSGTATPNAVNQLSSGCKVRKTTAQNIHFVNPPPIAKVIVPSRRRLTPASTNDSSAAEGANSKRTEITSFKSCGVPICRYSRELETWLLTDCAVHAACPKSGVFKDCMHSFGTSKTGCVPKSHL